MVEALDDGARASSSFLTSMTDLSLITVTYRSATTMPRFLAAARQAIPSAEIVVIDNASDDDTVQVVRRHDPAAKVICCAENLGFARGCNQGASQASAEWLLFLNPDLELRQVALPPPTPTRDTTLWSGLTAAGNTGAPRSELRADTSLAEDYLAQLYSHLLPPGIASRIPIRRRPPGWASGALFLTHRNAFARAGGFDPRYFLYYEDRDLGAEYRRHGMPIRELLTLVGTHQHGGSSSNVTSARREAWSFISWLEYLAKWRGQPTADRAAKRTFTVFERFIRLGQARAAIPRARTKAQHTAQVLRDIEDFEGLLPPNSGDYYPCARQAIRAAISRKVGK
jgi:N-acetylglucosaminyl-diphospho-decaprenol L-rhamnosyltransferase